MRRIKTFFLASTLLASSAVSAIADVNVVASIKPVHSLVAAVMQGVGEPGLIVEGAGSPHNYALKPSQAQMLESAKVVFWVGHELEAFLEKPLETIAANAKTVELIDAHGLVKLEFRKGGAFDDHAHGEEVGHDDHDDHDHGKKAEADHDDHDHGKKAEADHDDHDHGKKAEADHDDHDHGKKAEADHDDHDHGKKAEADHDDHGHGKFNPHVWLDPINAKALVHEIEEVLAEADPDNAGKYKANAETVMAELDALVTEVSADLKPVHDQRFIVFHDAYQYFEKRFDVTAAGSITVSPEVMPGAERITEIRAKVKDLGATCVFAEPQFEPKLVATVTERTQAKSGVIDPLGATLDTGPQLYFQLIRNMSTSIKTCLSEAS
ncbi:metal ABC transporter solute-binding protein, Zn/Mn family [Anderseniella sp. Alg231-50]|uniref:metal ABC transporter solute-binding protein, Zn/Mn family n=1 Tax=Anderseniella sp. Alg231-50 TaxID=1922226 RepID=UPI000D553703